MPVTTKTAALFHVKGYHSYISARRLLSCADAQFASLLRLLLAVRYIACLDQRSLKPAVCSLVLVMAAALVLLLMMYGDHESAAHAIALS